MGCSLPASCLENVDKNSQLWRFCFSISYQKARTAKSMNLRAPKEESLIISVTSLAISKPHFFFFFWFHIKRVNEVSLLFGIRKQCKCSSKTTDMEPTALKPFTDKVGVLLLCTMQCLSLSRCSLRQADGSSSRKRTCILVYIPLPEWEE